MSSVCDTDRPSLLSSSKIGSISKCECCDCYHLSLGCVTLRLEHKYMLMLTQMIIEALEVNSARERNYTTTDIHKYNRNLS